MKRGRAVLIVLAAVLALLLPGYAGAQTKGIGLSPALRELTLAEGQESVSFSINISNTTDAVADLRLSTLDFGALDESGGIAFVGRTGQETTVYGLRQWMTLEKDRLTLEPGQSEEVQITVANREDLGPGGHYGAVVVSAANSSENNDEVALIPAASTLVLLKKTGGDISRLELDSINTNSSWINLPKSATLRFQNSGNVHLVPRGTMELFGPTGSRLARGVVNPQSGFVLPESFRQFSVPLELSKQPWLPGRYKLVTTWRFDGTEQTTTTEQDYWYIGTLVLWLIAISSLGIVLYLYIRYRRRPPTRGQ